MILLDGKALAAKYRAEIAKEVNCAQKKGIRPPGLAVILVGEDPASQIYVRNKVKACQDANIKSEVCQLPADITRTQLLAYIDIFNKRLDIDGILLQLPLPSHLNAQECLEAIDYKKDVDGFHPWNVGKLCVGLSGFAPCTPLGMLALVKENGFSLNGKNAVVIGRSNLIGRPLSQLLSNKENNATVTLCHTGTKDLKKECLNADFLFVGAGRPKMITRDMVSEGCVVVDAGIHKTPAGLVGDVDFENVAEKTAAITPVPGGVGPMTIAMLLRNTVSSWKMALL